MGVIYRATCSANSKIYVGSAQNFVRRKNEHLKWNRNTVFGKAIAKHGPLSFSWDILEDIPGASPTVLLEREQFWLDRLKPFGTKGYNISRTARNGGFPKSEAMKAKSSKTMKSGAAASGLRHPKTRPIAVLNPSGSLQMFVSLTAFAKSLHENQATAYVAFRKYGSFRGWNFGGYLDRQSFAEGKVNISKEKF